MKKSSVRLFFMLLTVAGLMSIGVSSCKHEVPTPALPCDPGTVDFSRDILPLLNSRCGMCHSPDNPADGVVLTSYNAVMNSDVVEAVDPGESDLWERITETDPDKVMPKPPASPLSQEQKDLIRKWIEQGAQNISCDNGCDTSVVTWTATIQPLINSRCVGCHQGASPGGGINLSTYSGVSSIAANGSLMGAVQHQPSFSPMPKNQPQMPACDIAKLRIWVAGGALNN